MRAPGNLAAIFVLAAAVTGCARPAGRELSVYAASSLQDALLAGSESLESAAGIRIVFNFGASNDLARQIQAARRADVFLSADGAQVDFLQARGLIEPGTRASFLSNRLVVAVPAGSRLEIRGPRDLAGPDVRRISMGNPDGVPVGRYAREWLRSAGVWDDVAARVVPAANARAALAAVESGGVEVGVLYATDAALSAKVAVAYRVPAGEGPAISYVAAAIAGRPSLPEARALIDFLGSAGATKVFEPFGFSANAR